MHRVCPGGARTYTTNFRPVKKRGTFYPIYRNTYAFIYKNAYIVYTILNFIAYISQKFFISYN